ncbi:ROK family transcriptional regulator [Leifsonia sp. Root112D2]|uniref:ROK family transcriptional regulator n=1 Tax=Leifsonia sp. Root112D2 TaxID=1736426 RepID=UPI0006F550A2|nr:ROK family transcriptional regulator [Leifsonia sp. Root112D2]KQV06478.1 hypothetical protein ASC63_03330 [Leifsonia sp. Root112D2]
MGNPRISLATATSRGLVLDMIRTLGPISRVELAERTGLTQATMSNVARQLLDDELVIEAGRSDSTGGKPRVLLGINPTARFAVGVQVGADTLTYVVANLGGAIVGRTRTGGAGEREPAAMVQAIATRIDRLLQSLGVDLHRVMGIGIVAPGPLDLENGSILAPPTLGAWKNYPLRSKLSELTGLPVALDNDATAAAVGEFWSGKIGTSAAHCTVYMGAGIGAGIVLGGSVYRGASSNAGELGQMSLHARTGGERRTVEELAGPKAIVEQARIALGLGRESSIRLSSDTNPFIAFENIATAAVRGDRLARELLISSAEYLADALVAMANLLDLDSIVLAGPSFSTAGTLYLRIIQRRLDEEFFARAKHSVTVQLSVQSADAAAVGAASLILQQQLAPRQLGLPSLVGVAT